MAHKTNLSGRQHSYRFFLSCLIALALGLLACREYHPLEAEFRVNTDQVRTTLAGTVVDEAGKPVANAAIVAHGQSTVTNEFGYFVLPDILVPKDRALVLARHDGYFTAARAVPATGSGLTEIRLNLLAHGDETSVSASQGGTITRQGKSGSATVKLPAGGMTVNGQPYNGEVRVAARYLDPAEPSFASYFPGDELALRNGGSNTLLVSYGVLQVEMRTPAGEMVQPAPDRPAELSYPIPSTLKQLHSSIPLWYFDEQVGMWVEEGIAHRQGDRYVGTVKHFTPWNLDVPEETATITGEVRCGSRGMRGVVVRVGQSTVVTDAQGQFRRNVPANTEIEVQVIGDRNDDYRSDLIRVAPIAGRESKHVEIQLTAGCEATLTGRLTDQNGKVVPGVVTWVKSEGYAKIVTTLDGSFELSVPAETNIALLLSSWECDSRNSITVRSGAHLSFTELGAQVICGPGPADTTTGSGDSTITDPSDTTQVDPKDTTGATDPTEAFDIARFESLNTRAQLSPDGKYIAVVGHTSEALVLDAQSGAVISSTSIPRNPSWVHAAQFSSDGSRYLVNRFIVDGNEALVIETMTGKILQRFNINAAAYLLPDGMHVLQVDGTRGLSKYSVASGLLLDAFALNGISHDGRAAVASAGMMIYTCELTTGSALTEADLQYRDYNGTALQLSPDASLLGFVSYAQNEFQAMGVGSGVMVNASGITITDQCQYAFHPDSRHILFQMVQGGKSSLVLMNFRTGIVKSAIQLPSSATICGQLSISRDGKRVSAVLREDGKLKLRVWPL
jgi:hypothetical protein